MLHRVPNPVLCANRTRSSMMRAVSVAASVSVAVWLLAAAPLLSAGRILGPAMAAENNPPAQAADQQSGAKGDAKVELRLDAQHKVNGPAGNPECYELGTNALYRLVGDDIDAAFRHLDLYDRFGCPSAHIQAAYRCLLLHPATPDKKPDDPKAVVLDGPTGMIHACWVNPALPVTAASTAPAAAPPAPGPNPAASAAPAPNPKN
jgi:hypothetical protein